MNVNLKCVLPLLIEALGNAVLIETEAVTVQRVDMIMQLLGHLDRSDQEFDEVLHSFGYYLQ